jgi:transcription elongation factor Elf1
MILCPFCGHNDVDLDEYNYLDGKRWWYCPRCGLSFCREDHHEVLHPREYTR